jgi:response regulator of citrate/malate metabolism
MLNRFYKDKLPLIIIMSAISNGEEFLKSLNIPFNHFMKKPFQINDLFLTLQQYQQKKLTAQP